MSFLSVETITTIILAISVFVLIYLERKFPYRKGLPLFRDGFWVDMVWYTFFQSYMLKILIFGYIIYPIDLHFHLSSLHLITGWSLTAQVCFFLVTHDFYIYWFHRLQHKSEFFWRIHESHHSNKEVDWLAGTRSHAVEILINQTIEFAPIILLGANPVVVPIKALIDAVWGMYIHSNINVKSGKLQYAINGPEMHLWHHGDEAKENPRNFATKLAIWDWIFGTAYLPEGKPVRYGLTYDYPKDYFLQHFFSVMRIDEGKLRRNRWLKWYFNLRPVAMEFLRELFSTEKEYLEEVPSIPINPPQNKER